MRKGWVRAFGGSSSDAMAPGSVGPEPCMAHEGGTRRIRPDFAVASDVGRHPASAYVNPDPAADQGRGQALPHDAVPPASPARRRAQDALPRRANVFVDKACEAWPSATARTRGTKRRGTRPLAPDGRRLMGRLHPGRHGPLNDCVLGARPKSAVVVMPWWLPPFSDALLPEPKEPISRKDTAPAATGMRLPE
jgi:hypothetical protein